MKRVNVYSTIVDNPNPNYSAEFQTDEEMQDWINGCIERHTWGLPEREVQDPAWEAPAVSDGEAPPVPPTITLPAEFRVEIIDLDGDRDYQRDVVRRRRATLYPPITDLADALVHEAMGDSTKKQKYLDACIQVKEENPFP